MTYRAEAVVLLFTVLAASAFAQPLTPAQAQAAASGPQAQLNIAQSQVDVPEAPEAAEAPITWTDPATGIMWTGKDNGEDIDWDQAMAYCRDLNLGGFSDWRLPTMAELEGIYDLEASSPGRGGQHDEELFLFHIKGNLFLHGSEWSRDPLEGSSGRPSGYAWYFNFTDGSSLADPDTQTYNKHALCMRQTKQ